jgi:glycosyltransferase involved in cell wall biosynthesis
VIRVLHVIDHLGLGGAQAAVVDCLRHIDRAEFDVTVAAMHGRGQFADALEAAGIPVVSLARSRRSGAYIPRAASLLANGRWDVVHCHLNGSNWIAKPLAALAGVPVRVAHDHTSGELRFRGWGSVVPDALAHCSSTAVVAVSEDVRRFLLRWEAVDPSLVRVIPNGVDTDLFRPGGDAERFAARNALGLPRHARVVGAMSRLAPEKNLTQLVAAAAEVPDVYFVIAGTGPEEPRLRAAIASRGVADRVRLVGGVTDRVGFFHAIDVFALPSVFEALPMVLLEAMASGVPVVASRLDGIASALGGCGLLVPVGDHAGFVGALRGCLEASDEVSARTARALSRVQAGFSAAHTARAIESLHRDQLGQAISAGR